MRGFIIFLITLLAINANAQEWPTKTDTCNAIPLGVNFGACQMVLGWAYIDTGVSSSRDVEQLEVMALIITPHFLVLLMLATVLVCKTLL